MQTFTFLQKHTDLTPSPLLDALPLERHEGVDKYAVDLRNVSLRDDRGICSVWSCLGTKHLQYRPGQWLHLYCWPQATHSFHWTQSAVHLQLKKTVDLRGASSSCHFQH